MNTKAFLSFAVASATFSAFAAGWTIDVGPAWRSSVKMETRGTLTAPAETPRETIKRDMTDSANWSATDAALVADPNAGTGGIPADGKLWGLTDTRTEIYGQAGSDFLLADSNTVHPMGLNIRAGYDFYENETIAVGMNLRFTAFWNMRASSSGYFNAGLTTTETWTDSYIFPDEDPTSTFAPDSDYGTIESNGSNLDNTEYDAHGSRFVSTRLRSDLYQIGIGPKVTWHVLPRLDLYGGVEVLCNLAHSRFEADGVSTSQTDCLLGFAANIGVAGNITDHLGLYGQVGYEWIDKADIAVTGFRSEIDYSSLVLSAGVMYEF